MDDEQRRAEGMDVRRAVLGDRHVDRAVHVRAALRNGVTREEIKEVLLQVGVYAGVPAANRAFAIARRGLSEEDLEGRT